MKPIVLLTTALIVAAAGVPVFAQGGPAGKGGRMAALDANKDGAIDRSEAAKAPKLLENFDRLDANKDGRISAEERPQRGRHGGKGGRMAALDANKDGAIDRSEAAKAPKMLENFDRLDANKDGRISAEERPQRGRHGGKGDRAKLDVDGDQRVSRQEAAQRPQLAEKFAAIDGNRDGYLSREELQSYRREQGKRPQAPAKP
jgi:Ca2+-binding EF-hand superfamily protein